MTKRGKFVTFEGIDGSGKTTQLRLLAAHLLAEGREVVETVEPGGTDTGALIRKILLDPDSVSLTPRAELLLYFASRAQNVEERIRPALERGALVLCDRFTDSTLAYQGCGRGLPFETILALDQIASDGVRPDLTLLIDVEVAIGQKRLNGRRRSTGSGESRLDDETLDFHERVRKGYRAIAESEPERVVVVNGAPGTKEVEKKIWEAVARLV